MTAVLEAVDLSKSFPSKRDVVGRVTRWHAAVRGVSLHVDAGETLAVVGESGAGKTTLGRLLLRVIEPDQGQLRFQGIDVLALNRRDLRKTRRRMQMIFQNPYSSLDPRMVIADAVGEALTVHQGLRGPARDTVVRDLLERVGLQDYQMRRYPHEFSGGQLQRVAVARAIATDPDLIVCDEPVAALDVSIRAQIINLLRELQDERGLSYIFISHDLNLVRLIADRVAVLYKGRIVEYGDAGTVLSHPQHPYTQALLSVIPVADPRHRPPPAQTTPKAELDQAISTGCSYAERCQHAMAICRVTDPAPVSTTEGITVACHLRTAHGDADKVLR